MSEETLFEKLGVKYIEKEGIFYPLITLGGEENSTDVGILIRKYLSGSIIKCGISFPFQVPFNISRMSLLFNACLNFLLRISDLGPSIMTHYFRSGITVDHLFHRFQLFAYIQNVLHTIVPSIAFYPWL